MDSDGVHLDRKHRRSGFGEKIGSGKDIPSLDIVGTHKCVERIKRREFSMLVQG